MELDKIVYLETEIPCDVKKTKYKTGLIIQELTLDKKLHYFMNCMYQST